MPEDRAEVALPAGMVIASTPGRAMAYIVDYFLLGAISIGLFVVATRVLGMQSPSSLGLTGLPISLVYFVVSWSRFGSSLGQRLLGLRVRDEGSGGTLPYPRAIWRWIWLDGAVWVLPPLARYAATALGGDAPLGGLAELPWLAYVVFLLITTARDPRHQGFHDQRAGTLVTRRAPDTRPTPTNQRGSVPAGYGRGRRAHGRRRRRR